MISLLKVDKRCRLMKKFSRTELYNELLKNNLKVLSDKYHIDYNQFRSFCHQNNIPIPGPKYRMYLKMNRDVSDLIKPLPAAETDIIYFQINDKNNHIKNEIKELNDPLKIEQIEQVLGEFKYSPKKPLSSKVRNFKKSIQSWKKNHPYNDRSYEWYKWYSDEHKPKFMDDISSKELPRLYRLLDRIYLIFDQLGEEVKDDFTIIIGGKDEVPFSISEYKDSVKHKITKEEQAELDEYEKDQMINPDLAFKPRIRKYDHPNNGKFKIKIDGYPYHAYIRDTNKGKLEDKISQIIIEFYKEYICVRNERLAREEAEQKEKEEKEKKIQRAECINAEKKKVQKLITEARDYKISMQIREYANTVEDSKYRKWILQKASWLDPTVHKEDKILGMRDYSKDLKEYLKDLQEIENDRYW